MAESHHGQLSAISGTPSCRKKGAAESNRQQPEMPANQDSRHHATRINDCSYYHLGRILSRNFRAGTRKARGKFRGLFFASSKESDYFFSAGAGAAAGAAEDIGACGAGAAASGAGVAGASSFFLQPAAKARAITRHRANESSFFIDIITSFLF